MRRKKEDKIKRNLINIINDLKLNGKIKEASELCNLIVPNEFVVIKGSNRINFKRIRS